VLCVDSKVNYDEEPEQGEEGGGGQFEGQLRLPQQVQDQGVVKEAANCEKSNLNPLSILI
jgi:hypothetical protein